MKHLPKICSLLFMLLSCNSIMAQDISKPDSGKIIYLEKTNSLVDLFGKFKGSVVYVDFWGTWCSSCFAEFKPEPELDAFLKANKIVRLYIALEKPQSDSVMWQKSVDQWKKSIQKYNLEGYHYYGLLFSDFMRGVTEMVMKGKLSLPRFAIIDKNGIVVDRDARRPSNPEGLIKVLSRYLNNN